MKDGKVAATYVTVFDDDPPLTSYSWWISALSMKDG